MADLEIRGTIFHSANDRAGDPGHRGVLDHEGCLVSNILLLSVGHDRGDLKLLLPVATGDIQRRRFYHKASDLPALVGSEGN